MVCRYCGYDMGSDELLLCPKCFKSMELNEENIKNISATIRQMKPKRKKSVVHDYSDEEILALGLYPKDEGYKMSLISRILGK